MAPKGRGTALDSRGTRWLILVGYWIVQAVVVTVLELFFYGTTAGGEWELLPPAEYLDAFWDEGVWQMVLIWAPILTGLQFLLVLPVQLNLPARERGKSVYLSLAAAGAMIAALLVGFVAAGTELVVLYDLAESRDWSWLAMGVGLLLSWLVFTALLVRYANRSRLHNDDLVTRVARIVFAGTVIETVALIPIDVMVRRKTDCYCWAGSLMALMLSGAIGFVVAGPAVFLPLFARRPRRLREGNCEWCGYDRVGIADALPCPECGRVGVDDLTKP